MKTTVPVAATALSSVNFVVFVVGFVIVHALYEDFDGSFYPLFGSVFWTLRHCYVIPMALLFTVKSNEKQVMKSHPLVVPPLGLQFHDYIRHFILNIESL